MKLDPKNIRYLSTEDWRVLTAVEQGSRNHEVVPTPLIVSLTNTRSGASGVQRCISTLAKLGLVSRVKNAAYDGYRLTYGGLDYLALHAHVRSGALYSVGNQIGVGKESDIFVAASAGGRRLVVKIHRLGRISFRSVKAKRDYLRNRAGGSWMHMSRLAALKEFAFMRALRAAGFEVPEPVACNRHTVVMSLVEAFPLRQIARMPDPAGLYARLVEMIVALARVGLIHGDFNEFNILIEEKEPRPAHSSGPGSPPNEPATTQLESSQQETAEPQITLNPVLIDFPQMVSVSHPNAAFYFDRDVGCVKRFFERRFGFVCDEPGPFLDDVLSELRADAVAGTKVKRLDAEVEASGFSKKMAKELESYMEDVGVDGDGEVLLAGGGGDAEDGPDAVSAELDGGDGNTELVDSPDKTAHTMLSALASGINVLELDDNKDEDERRQAYSPSVISAAKNTRSNTNAAKAAKGWVI